MIGDDVGIWCGDCRDLMGLIPSGSVDAIVTDPPYGTRIERDGYGRRNLHGGTGRHIANDSDLSTMDDMLVLAPRVLKSHAWVVVFCSPKRHAEAAEILVHRGFPIAGEVIWDKASPGLGGGIRYQHETILLARHGEPTGNESLFSVIRSHVSNRNKHLRHPHEKPLDLMRALVRYSCPRSGLVLDPFAGSGTTLVACMKSGRRAIGIEIEPGYIPLVERRIEATETPLFMDREAP